MNTKGKTVLNDIISEWRIRVRKKRKNDNKKKKEDKT